MMQLVSYALWGARAAGVPEKWSITDLERIFFESKDDQNKCTGRENRDLKYMHKELINAFLEYHPPDPLIFCLFPSHYHPREPSLIGVESNFLDGGCP